MTQFTYLTVNFLAVIICFIFSFHPKIKFNHHFLSFFKASFIVLIPFIIWDAWFADIGVWWFNDDYLLGIRLLGLPLEEWLFFICIPFACVYTYFCLTKFFNWKWKPKADFYLSASLAIIFLILAVLTYEMIYPFITFLVTAFTLIYLKFIAKVDWIGQATVIYILLLPGFFVVNGVLTGTGLESPIVNYTEGFYLGIRMGTIPVEDSIYGYALILWNLYFFKMFSKGKIESVKE